MYGDIFINSPIILFCLSLRNISVTALLPQFILDSGSLLSYSDAKERQGKRIGANRRLVFFYVVSIKGRQGQTIRPNRRLVSFDVMSPYL